MVILLYESLPVGEFIDNGISKHRHCKQQKENFYSKHAKIFDKLHIHAVRNVCISFGTFNKGISLYHFNSLILLDNNTNVWFSEWRGIQLNRMAITDHLELRRNHGGEDSVLAMIKTSPRILKDTRKYVNTILKTDFKEYTAVSFRATNKKTALVYSGHSRDYIIQYFQKCAEKVKLELLKNPSSIKFLSIDLGRFSDLTSVYGYFKINDDGNK